jgi:hypothetical protein
LRVAGLRHELLPGIWAAGDPAVDATGATTALPTVEVWTEFARGGREPLGVIKSRLGPGGLPSVGRLICTASAGSASEAEPAARRVGRGANSEAAQNAFTQNSPAI